jgi:hypothetical protein
MPTAFPHPDSPSRFHRRRGAVGIAAYRAAAYAHLRRSLSRLKIKTIAAMTNGKWITPPPMVYVKY